MPVVSPEPCLPLSKQRRREICVHEAGHAIVHAIGGSFVYRVAVAPEGDTGSWTFQGRKGDAETGLAGVCETSDCFSAYRFLRWSSDAGCYEVDRRGFEERNRQLASFAATMAKPGIARYITSQQSIAAKARRVVRANLCGILAGLIAEQIYIGQEVFIPLADGLYGPGDDLVRAEAIAMILPRRRELEHAAGVVEDALRDPATWGRVIRLADELERVGDIEDLGGLLPYPQPDWPPPPPRRASTPKARASR